MDHIDTVGLSRNPKIMIISTDPDQTTRMIVRIFVFTCKYFLRKKILHGRFIFDIYRALAPKQAAASRFVSCGCTGDFRVRCADVCRARCVQSSPSVTFASTQRALVPDEAVVTWYGALSGTS